MTSDAGWDTYLESDLPRVYQTLTDARESVRVNVHPLIPLLSYPLTQGIILVGRLEPINAIRVFTAIIAAVWLGLAYLLTKWLLRRRLDAILFTLLAMFSASAVFWFAVPETFTLGSVAILATLGLTAWAERRGRSPVWYAASIVATFGTTVTNGIVGVIAAFVQLSWKKAVMIIVVGVAATTLLWLGQKRLCPKAEFPFNWRCEAEYICGHHGSRKATPWRPDLALKVFLFDSTVIGQADEIPHTYNPNRPYWPIMSVQKSSVGSGGWPGRIAFVLWSLLLLVALAGFFRSRRVYAFRLVLGLSILSQLIIYLLYGNETFLYSLHYQPLLVLLAAMACETRLRPAALALAACLVPLMAVNNLQQFAYCTGYPSRHAVAMDTRDQRTQLLEAMKRRPADPWPRGIGHVVLAEPGSKMASKAYHEPGGSFSPMVSSFGVSFWVTSEQGDMIYDTSDSIPLADMREYFYWSTIANVPSIVTETSSYRAIWTALTDGRCTLQLRDTTPPGQALRLLIRSPGPAGGPVYSLKWNGQGLIINDRWFLAFSRPLKSVVLGSEQMEGWKTLVSDRTEWAGLDGWGFARLGFAKGSQDTVVAIQHASYRPALSPSIASVRSGLKLDIPDGRFTACLDAQIAHLMMSIVDRQTRPGEPVNYPLAWLRDGAYVVVSLARAGRSELARELATYFAENDFFGGFGPEADAPGLALWALGEVACRIREVGFDKYLWPHVKRKADYILKMRSATENLFAPVSGPIVPRLRQNPELPLVCNPAQHGLIVGKMDHHRPILYVNAVSYRGLIEAAALADRLGHQTEAQSYRDAAAQIRQAWQKALETPEAQNGRTYICALWPTWVVDLQSPLFGQLLESRWAKFRNPAGDFVVKQTDTYFTAAEAHQWLLLGQADRAWKTLLWFWNNQASPGLYTWWEGEGEENTFGIWSQVRGWVHPPYVTPHYWTAAEIALLQLDMLAYVDESQHPNVLVIGAGIPKEWLSKPISVEHLSTRIGQIDWSWFENRVDVTIHGSQCPVRLGRSFPEGTVLNVKVMPIDTQPASSKQ